VGMLDDGHSRADRTIGSRCSWTTPRGSRRPDDHRGCCRGGRVAPLASVATITGSREQGVGQTAAIRCVRPCWHRRCGAAEWPPTEAGGGRGGGEAGHTPSASRRDSNVRWSWCEQRHAATNGPTVVRTSGVVVSLNRHSRPGGKEVVSGLLSARDANDPVGQRRPYRWSSSAGG